MSQSLRTTQMTSPQLRCVPSVGSSSRRRNTRCVEKHKITSSQRTRPQTCPKPQLLASLLFMPKKHNREVRPHQLRPPAETVPGRFPHVTFDRVSFDTPPRGPPCRRPPLPAWRLLTPGTAGGRRRARPCDWSEGAEVEEYHTLRCVRRERKKLSQTGSSILSQEASEQRGVGASELIHARTGLKKEKNNQERKKADLRETLYSRFGSWK